MNRRVNTVACALLVSALVVPAAQAGSQRAPVKHHQLVAHTRTSAYIGLVHKKAPKVTSKSVKAKAWSFPRCANAQVENEYIYSGDPCFAAPPAKAQTIVVAPAPEGGAVSHTAANRASPGSCNGNAEYDYVYSGCGG